MTGEPFCRNSGLPPTYQFQFCVICTSANRYGQRFFLLGQFLCLLCSAHYRESSPRYRSLPSVPSNPSSIIWLPRGKFSQHFWPRQRASRLAIYAISPKSDCRARDLYSGESFEGVLSRAVYALASTTAIWCLSLSLGQFRPQDAVKKAPLLNYGGHSDQCLCYRRPSSRGNILDMLPEAGAVLQLARRGYVDFARLYCLWRKLVAFFVTSRKRICSSIGATHAPSTTTGAIDANHSADRVRTPSAIPTLAARSTIFDARKIPD